MLRQLKSWISVTFNIPHLYGFNSFSQYGEDLEIVKLLKTRKPGFYVDIGAHHPFRYSNTYLLYKSGWSGLNLDPADGVVEMFAKTRPIDKTVNSAVGKKKNVYLYSFSDHALNTLDKFTATNIQKSGQAILRKKRKVEVVPLKLLLSKYAKNKNIDFINIDVEGLELEVLKSNDWERFRPRVICIENFRDKQVISSFLSAKGYNLVKQVGLSGLYEIK